jgi:hypothetical protein
MGCLRNRKRRDWPHVRSELESLTADKINDAIGTVSNHQPIPDSTANSLLRHLRSVGTYDPHFFASKMTSRAEMKGVPGFQTSTQSLLVHMGQISLMLSPHLLTLLTSIEELISELPISRATIQRGMTDFWLTLNPSGFRNLLVLQLAGIEIAADAMPSAAAAMRHIPSISNPVAVAEVFHYLCEVLFANWLRSGRHLW